MTAPHPAQLYRQEAEELLAQIEDVVLELQPGDGPGEAVNQIFRAFHTIKGSGAMFGFEAIAAFTHHVETTLDHVRAGAVRVSAELIELVLAAKDHIAELLLGDPPAAAVLAEGETLMARLHALSPAITSAATDRASTPVAADPRRAADAPAAALETFRIRFRPDRGILASGTDPRRLLAELRELGECRVVGDASQTPPLAELTTDQCHLAWDITLTTDRGENAIRDVFVFVEDGSELRVTCVAPEATALPADSVVETSILPKTPGGAAPARADSSRPRAAAAAVRVPSERLDRLVNLVGELVMNQSRLTQVAARADLPDLNIAVEELERLVAEMRDNVLGIRMMPIGTTFGRFKRLVHDLALELGKQVELATAGAETELDKTVLDQLGDPLVHLIRNCVDHGIEPPDARTAAGKPAAGSIRLSAAHQGSNVVLTIEDDGRGIDPAAVQAKAVEKGIIAADAKLSRREIFDLLFLPGFSTAKQVTNVSGRGVGLDVVKRQVEALRGAIAVESEPGAGARITITLPLTLAIIDGLLVEVAGDKFIVPMPLVAENVDLARAERARGNGRNLLPVRGELVPYIRLRETFAMSGAELPVEKVVIVRHAEERVGLVVDRVLGSHQTVIQSLGRFYQQVEVLSGATIMGDGRVALILDVAGLVRRAMEPPPGSAGAVPDFYLPHPSPAGGRPQLPAPTSCPA